jgi:hypothetical protein
MKMDTLKDFEDIRILLEIKLANFNLKYLYASGGFYPRIFTNFPEFSA